MIENKSKDKLEFNVRTENTSEYEMVIPQSFVETLLTRRSKNKLYVDFINLKTN